MWKVTILGTDKWELTFIFDADQFSVVLLDAYHHPEHTEIWAGLGPFSLVFSYERT